MNGLRVPGVLLLGLLLVVLVGCSSAGDGSPDQEDRSTGYRLDLDDDSGGYIEETNNIVNTSIVSNDPNVFKAEYEAGFIQGQLQADSIPAARDNSWDGTYLTDPDHTFPKKLPPSAEELDLTARTLVTNWNYTLDYIANTAKGDVQENLRRLVYRLVGIYDGATKDSPADLPFDADWVPQFSEQELTATYEAPQVTFMDLYYLNTTGDLFDVLPAHGVKAGAPTGSPPAATGSQPSSATSKCTAFVRVAEDDIYLTHNTWSPFLDQSQALQIWVNGDFMSTNAIDPGYLGSGTDFGYTNKGLVWNETTEDSTFTEPRVESIWTMWRETLAEQYAGSIQQFFDYISIEQSGTYMNGYMVVDAKRDQLGYVEMSYDTTVFYRIDSDKKPGAKGAVEVSTKPAGLSTAYDKQMVRPDYILGFNYPASLLIRKQLKAINNRPARRVQLLEGIDGVTDIEAAKSLITHTAPDNPLSIYGRWDLGYGETTTPQTVPDGSIDAKAVSASMAQSSFTLTGVLDPESDKQAFWMKFGTPEVQGKPFIWSESQWSGQKLRDVPDVVSGAWTLLPTNIG